MNKKELTFMVLVAAMMGALSLLCQAALGSPPQAPRPPQAPPTVNDVVPVPAKKTCGCSPACTCGCNEGEPCRCVSVEKGPVWEVTTGVTARLVAPRGELVPSQPVRIQPQFAPVPVQQYRPMPAPMMYQPQPRAVAPVFSRGGSC